MSAPKRGLGRGLDVLLGESRPAAAGLVTSHRCDSPEPTAAAQEFRSTCPCGTGAVDSRTRRPRADYRAPITGVGRRRGLRAHCRRTALRASAAAKLATIPAIVREADDRSSMELAVVEKLQRQDLDPLEEAMGSSTCSTSTGSRRSASPSESGRAARPSRTRSASSHSPIPSRRASGPAN